MDVVPPDFDPLAIAHARLSKSYHSLQGLILHSEKFDYLQAKKALKQLEDDIEALDRTRCQFGRLLMSRHGNIQVVDFGSPAGRPRRQVPRRQPASEEFQGQLAL